MAANTTVTPLAVPASSTATFELFIRETGGNTLQTLKLSGFGVRGTYGTPGVLTVPTTAASEHQPRSGLLTQCLGN